MGARSHAKSVHVFCMCLGHFVKDNELLARSRAESFHVCSAVLFGQNVHEPALEKPFLRNLFVCVYGGGGEPKVILFRSEII